MESTDRYEFFINAPTETIQAGITTTQRIIDTHDRILCSVSGGADSDCMMDYVLHLDKDHKVKFVFFDTGLEMDATKRHIQYLEQKYDVAIETVRPKTPIPAAIKKYGYPFLSKFVSENIARLQKHNFAWVDEPFEDLYRQYPNCKSALKWWCNTRKGGPHAPMQNEIGSVPYLKEFMVAYPPQIPISGECCNCAKKVPAHKYSKNQKIDITFLGIRKAEGGARSVIKTCYIDGKYGEQHFPCFWWKNEDKKAYESAYDVTHSAAYSVYGCKRTGCSGCPFGSRFEDELKMLDKYEPQLARAARNVFGAAYEYTRAYLDFRLRRKKRAEKMEGQMEMIP